MKLRVGELFKFLSVKGTAYIGVLSALALISSRFASFYMIPSVRVDPAGPAVIMIAGMLFGPVAGMIVGGLSDVIGFLIYNPTGLPWNPFVFAGQITYGLVAGIIVWLIKKTIEGQSVIGFFKPEKTPVWKIVLAVIIAQLCGFIVITIGLTFIMPNNPTFWGLFLTRVPFQPLFMIWYSTIAGIVIKKIFEQKI